MALSVPIDAEDLKSCGKFSRNVCGNRVRAYLGMILLWMPVSNVLSSHKELIVECSD